MVIKSKIPETPGKTPSYCCTWILQNYFANLSGEATDHHLIVGNYLTEEAMSNFVHNTPFMSRARGDMILLHDLGWDLPVNFNYNIGESQFLNMLGSMTVAEDKFPSCTGSPAEKLKKLCQTVKDAGWKGTGIWVPSHAFEEPEGCTEEWLRNFYLERLEWSLDAGVSYWKVDYGIHSNDIRFREMITRLAEAAAPGLFIEHAKPSGFFNDFWGAGGVLSGSGRYAEWLGGDLLKQAKETALVSHVLRIYDVSDELSIPTTIDRVSELFIGLSKVKTNCIINCENEPYIGAVLGCAIGMMTHPYHKSIRPTFAEYKSQTAVEKNFIRAAMWQRIAPAVHAGENECHLEGGLLEDSWKFSPDSCFIGGTGCTSDTVVKQIAPAVFALNIKPPVVQNSKNGDAPFVLASSSENGNITCSNDSHQPNASTPILVTFSGMTITFKLIHE